MTSPNINPPNRPSAQARDAAVIAGIKKRLQNVPSVVLAGVTYTPAALEALYENHLEAAAAVESLKAQWKAAVQAYETSSKTLAKVTFGLREIVRQMFDNAPAALADFDFTPRKTSQKSPVTQVVAAERNRATRKARNTLGPKAKLRIKGAPTASEISAAVGTRLEAGAFGLVDDAPAGNRDPPLVP
jgi:hypothetical protein